MMEPDFNNLIGLPFKDFGRGPNFYDCFGLMREVMHRYGVEIPDENTSVYACSEAQKKIDDRVASQWLKLEQIETPCLVLFRGFTGFANHIGVHIGDKKFIHTYLEGGVCVELLWRWKHKIEGFYKYVGTSNSS